jgi:HNH endonuclease
MADTKREFVHRRALGCCEYCHLPESGHDERFSVDHITARKHGGSDSTDNLALSCLRCNLYKGTDLSGIDPLDQSVVALFHPRKHRWADQFRWNGAVIIGLTPTGRATVATLQMNGLERVRLRQFLMSEGILFAD